MKKKGFTLIEILVTAIISSIVLLGIVSVIVVSNKVVNRSVLESQMQSNGQMLLETIGDDVKRGIVLASTGTGMTIRDSVGVFATYTFADGKLLKNGKALNVFADSYVMSGSFAINTFNRYYSVKIDLDLALQYKAGEVFRTNKISNTYYCRLDPEGYGL